MTKTQKAGLYIHIPFCLKKCPYCNFYSICDLTLEDDYVASILKEIEKNQKKEKYFFNTVYFGGGTPSILKTSNLEKILNKVFSCFKIDKNCEITIETNPKTINKDKLIRYREIGINRINIGVQSFCDKNLKTLGRIHSKNDAILAITLSEKAKFENIGIDLMYSLPNQTVKCWIEDLKKALSFSLIKHLSCYNLNYEVATPFYEKRGRALSEKKEVELFRTTIEFLKKANFFQYEVSNFAKKKSESKHNQKYWNYVPYLGLGTSAHSFDGEKRFWNVSNIKKYIESIKSGSFFHKEVELLSLTQKKTKLIYLGFRQTRGIDINFYNQTLNADFFKDFKKKIEFFKKEGFIDFNKNYCFLTTKGLLLLNSICLEFI